MIEMFFNSKHRIKHNSTYNSFISVSNHNYYIAVIIVTITDAPRSLYIAFTRVNCQHLETLLSGTESGDDYPIMKHVVC